MPHIAELESTTRSLEDKLQDVKFHQDQTSHQLAHSQEQLRSHSERVGGRARDITVLEAEIEKLSTAQTDQAW